MGIALALTIFLGVFVPSVSADVFVYGSNQNYGAVILPNTSYVHQGANISQGNYYDLRGVYGFSGEVAHWNNDDSTGKTTPDQIVTLKGGRILTLIDPAQFPTGRWWQWDGKEGFGHGNAYAFYVVGGQQNNPGVKERTIVQTSTITILQNGESIQIPVTYAQVETYYVTPTPTTTPLGSGTIMVSPTETPIPTIVGPTNQNVQDRNGNTIPGGVAGATVVTQKSPAMILIPIFAVIVGLIVLKKKK